MKQTFKKSLSLLLAMVMLLGLLPTAVFAEEAEGDQWHDESYEAYEPVMLNLDDALLGEALSNPLDQHFTAETADKTIPAGAIMSGVLEIDAGVTVKVMGAITVATTGLIVKGGGTLVRDASFTSGSASAPGSMFVVPDTAILTIQGDVVLDGGNILATGTVGGAVHVDSGGKLEMTGGTIQNFKTNAAPGGGAVYVGGENSETEAGTFDMSGGTIQDNRYESQIAGQGGGGVAVLGTFNMSNKAMITNNYSGTNGGGIFLAGNHVGGQYAEINITGGSIMGNTARRWGGGMEAISNPDCKASTGKPKAQLTITGGKITGNLSNYQNSRANDGFGGGLETTDMGGEAKFYVGGDALITGNNHWTSSGYTQDNLYCGTTEKTGMPILKSNFTGTIGITPGSSQAEGDAFGKADGKTVAEGRFFYDGKDLVNTENALEWKAPTAGVVLTGVTVEVANGVYTAKPVPADGATATYQWYASDTNSVSGGLPIPGAHKETYKPGPDMSGKYIYVIADGTGSTTRRATSKLYQVAPKLTGDFTLFFNKDDGKLHKNSISGEVLDTSYGYYAKESQKPYDTLVLNNFNFVSSKGSLEMPNNATIELAAGSMNSIESTSRTNDDWKDWGIHTAGDGKDITGSESKLTITGTGTLSVKGACAAIMVHYSKLLIDGSAVVTAEGNGYPGTAARDSAGIYAMNGIIVDGTADVTAIGGPCQQNSYGAGSNMGGVTVKDRAVLTVAGGQTRDTTGTYRSMGIATSSAFSIEGSGSVIARGNTVAADIWYNTDGKKNVLTAEQINTMFAGTTIEASTSANGAGATNPANYVAFSENLDWKDSAINKGTIYKWVRIYKASGVADKLLAPTFIAATGSYSTKVTVNINSSAGADIYYTMDGTEPSKSNGTKYNSIPFDITTPGTVTVKAIAYKVSAVSPVTTVTYTVVAAPTLSGLTLNAVAAGAGTIGAILAPAFSATTTEYRTVVPSTATAVNVTATAGSGVAMTVGGTAVKNPIALTGTDTVITVTVGNDTVGKTSYTITVHKASAGSESPVYEPLNISSGFNKDVVVDKTGTLSSWATPFDGNNSGAQFAFYSSGFKAENALPAEGKVKSSDGSTVLYQLGPYDGKNDIQLTASAPKAEVRFSTIGTYDKLSVLGASANGGSSFSVTIHYTDGTASTTSFNSLDWYYGQNMVVHVGRVKLTSGAVEYSGNGPCLMAYDVTVTPGKLVSYLTLQRTGGGADSWANIMAISGVINAGSLPAPGSGDMGQTPNQDGSVTLTWKNNEDAIGYYIDIANDENFLDMLPNYNNKQLQPSDYEIVLKDQNGSGDPAFDTVEYTISDIKSGPVYYRVRTVNSAGKQGPSSDSVKVEIKGEVVTDSSLKLNAPAILDENAKTQSYSFSNAIVGVDAKTIIVGFAKAVNTGDRIVLPDVSGFTVSSTSNDYSKRITVGAGKTAADIQAYLRQIVFYIGKNVDSGKFVQDIQVSLNNEAIDKDTFYFETTGHYYQYVPMGSNASWMDCYNAASQLTYAGRRGYLATVVDKNEDLFIKSLSGQIGWLGGTRMMTISSDPTVLTNKVTYKNDENTAVNGARQYYKDFVTKSGTHPDGDTGDAHKSNPWIWACGPEIGQTMSYTNWGAGEPNGIGSSGDSHECCLTTLYQGSGSQTGAGYSWNDRNEAARPGIGSNGWQPYGFIVEYGDTANGDSSDVGGKPSSTTTVTDTATISKDGAVAPGSGEASMDLTQLPEIKAPVTSDPNWKPVPGTSPVEYKYVGTEPANGDGLGWEWRYTPEQRDPNGKLIGNEYALILNGINLTTTNRPAINLPDYPSNDSTKPVYIKVVDGTTNTVKNLEDADKTTDVTIIDSKRDLVLMPYGPKNDGTLLLEGSNEKDSQKGVFGIVSYGDVTVSSLDLTIKLTDNRPGSPEVSDPSTGIKSEGDIKLDNPKLDIEIVVPNGTGTPGKDTNPPARGLEPGNPRNNVYINGGEVDIVVPTPKQETYPAHRPIYMGDEKTPVIPADYNDPQNPLFPIAPPQPTANVIGSNVYVYAKGGAIIVKPGTPEGSAPTTTVYWDKNRNCEAVDGTDKAIANAENIKGSFNIYLYAGDSNAASAGWPIITVIDGKVTDIYAGGSSASAAATLTGSPVINIVGGTVENLYDGGKNNINKLKADTIGITTFNISGGTVNTVSSNGDVATRSQSVYVNFTGGTVGTMKPNSNNPITLAVSGAPTLNTLLDYQNLAGKVVSVSGKLTGGRVNLEVKADSLKPGDIIATATDESHLKGGNFTLTDTATGTTVKGKQLKQDGVNMIIADGGPTVLKPLDLGGIQVPTGTDPEGWTGPNATGRYEYNEDKPADGWELEYQPADPGAKPNPIAAHYILTMNKFNMEAEGNTGLTLPKGAPTTVKVVGSENKIVIRGTGPVVGIYAPKGVDFIGENADKDILTIIADNGDKTTKVTGVKSDEGITVKKATIDVTVLGKKATGGTGLDAGKGDVIIENGDVVIDIPDAAPAKGITTPGNIEIKDTDPSDGRKPTVEIDIGGKKDEESTGLETTAPGKGDIIISGGEIYIDITTGKPAIGIKADDDVIVKPNIIPPAKPGDPEKPGDQRPNVDVVIGDKKEPGSGGYPSIGIQAEDKDKTGEPTTPGGIIIGQGDIKIDIPNAPGNYQPNTDTPPTSTAPNKGMDSKGDVIIGDGSDIVIEVTGPAIGIKTEPSAPSKGDVVIEDSDIDIKVIPNPKPPTGSDPVKDNPGPAIGIDSKGDVVIDDTKPDDDHKPVIGIVIGSPDVPDAKGAPNIGINTDPTPANPNDPADGGGDIFIGGVDMTIEIPNAKGAPNIGINSDKEITIKPDPKSDDPSRPATKPDDPGRPDINITIGDRLEPGNVGPGTGIKGKDEIDIGGSDIVITIPDTKPTTDTTPPAKYDPNKGIEGDKNIIIGDESDLKLDITGPGTGIDGKKDVDIKDSDVDIEIKTDPDKPAPTNPDPTIGIKGDNITIENTGPGTRYPGVVIKEEGDGPTKGLEADKNITVEPGGRIDIGIEKGAPAIGIEAGEDVIIGNTDPDNKNPDRPDIGIVIGDKKDPNSGGQPGKGILADGDIKVGDTDLVVDVKTKPAPTRPVVPTPPDGPATEPDPDKPTTGLEAGGDVDIKGSDVDINVTDDTKPVPNSGPGTGILSGGDVTAEDTNLDIIVTGRPGKGIEPKPDTGKVDIQGDTDLDIEVKPTDPSIQDPSPAIDGDLVIATSPAKPNVIVKGVPNNNPVTGDIKDDKNEPIAGELDPDTGNLIIVTNGITTTLKVSKTATEDDPFKVSGKIGAALTVSNVTLTLTGEAKFKNVKAGDILSTNCPGVNAVVSGVTEKQLTLTLSGTPTTNRGTAVSVTLPAGKIDGINVSMKATDDTALWAIALPAGTTVGREEPLKPGKFPMIYIDENGEEKTIEEPKPGEQEKDITDTGEGWEWYPERPAPKPGDPGYEKDDEKKYPHGYVEVDGKKYPRPALILDDVDIKPADDVPGITVDDETTIVVPVGSDNIIEGGGSPTAQPAIKVEPGTDPIVITGPGNLILKGVPAIDGPKPTVDPDVFIKGDNRPIGPTDLPGSYKEIVFGHANAVIEKLRTGVTGTVDKAITDVTGVQVTLQNASLMPNSVRLGAILDTNSDGVFAKVTGVAAERTNLTVTLTGTPVAASSEKVMVTVPSEYVLEGATLVASSTQRWNITVPPTPPAGGGGDTPTPPGSVEVGGEDKDVDIKKEVKKEDGKKIDIFTPDKKQLDEVIGDRKKGDEIIIDVKKDADADEVIIKINGETLEDMKKKEIDLIVREDLIGITVPTKDLDIGPILKELGGEPKDVDVNIRIYEPSDEEKEAIRKAIETDGSKQTDEPISFEISVSKDGKTVPVDGFDGYVTVAIQITEEQAAKITTAITWQKDGKLLHIPTYVLKEGGKYYAKVNALVNCTTTLIFNEQNFVDTTGEWYDAVATELASRKIMNGVGNNKFEGGLNITRAEFAVIVVRALGLPVSEANAFSDVSGDDWYAGAAGAAAKYGIVNGADGKFMPMNQITRQEAMAIIARAAKVAEYTGSTGSVAGYGDSGTLADWAKDAAGMTVGSGLIKGNDGQLRPTDTITRGETAVLILRLLQKADLVDVRSAT